jgi:uncharacterized membrane protein YfcA
MPFPVKLALSVIVIAVAIAAYYFQDAAGQVGPKYAILFLAPFMVVAMWIFPEVNRKDVTRR